MKYEVESRIKDFLEKYHAKKLIIDDEKLGTFVMTEYGRSNLVQDLAEAIHEFEIVDRSSYTYDSKLEKLNKMINLANTHNIIKENPTSTEKLNECQEKCKNLENKLKEKDVVIESLRSERDYWKGRYDTMAKYVPLPKGDDTFEGDVVDDKSS